MTEVNEKDVVEAKYRFEKAWRMLDQGATANAKAAIAQGYDALGGDPDDLER